MCFPDCNPRPLKSKCDSMRLVGMRQVIYLYTILLIGLYTAYGSQTKISKNGFALDNSLIPPSEIHSGGPPRDGIPSIDKPKFITTTQATFMRAKDRVVSVEIGKETRAYPLRILVWHEIVNDHIGNMDIVVTYCPLCGTAMVFNRNNTGKTRTFGVSGLLYNSDMLMYDRETKSLWSQLMMQAISGPATGETRKGRSYLLIPGTAVTTPANHIQAMNKVLKPISPSSTVTHCFYARRNG